jgi:hypothetical protein
MNHDAKLYAKERLRVICKTVIGPEQLAFVEKRDIHERAPHHQQSARIITKKYSQGANGLY